MVYNYPIWSPHFLGCLPCGVLSALMDLLWAQHDTLARHRRPTQCNPLKPPLLSIFIYTASHELSHRILKLQCTEDRNITKISCTFPDLLTDTPPNREHAVVRQVSPHKLPPSTTLPTIHIQRHDASARVYGNSDNFRPAPYRYLLHTRRSLRRSRRLRRLPYVKSVRTKAQRTARSSPHLRASLCRHSVACLATSFGSFAGIRLYHAAAFAFSLFFVT